MALLKRTDWNGNEIYYLVSDLVRYELRLARIRDEVAEVRSAVEAMRVQSGAFLEEVADFLEREALQLERVNEADGPVELDSRDDTREQSGYAPTSARRALLIARAFQRPPTSSPGRTPRAS
ncbi:hypothetical protein ABZ297_06315 [Nonomuraea sp. NPDC005983]|uniref:hypothetical protein n=1 Tax=Nonomuraea sp. NPDC005983 TaxID=3155595 RepID=UPI0033A6F966